MLYVRSAELYTDRDMRLLRLQNPNDMIVNVPIALLLAVASTSLLRTRMNRGFLQCAAQRLLRWVADWLRGLRCQLRPCPISYDRCSVPMGQWAIITMRSCLETGAHHGSQ
jgi:hypothetical protein